MLQIPEGCVFLREEEASTLPKPVPVLKIWEEIKRRSW